MSITIAYFTCRKEPKIEWFFRSLNRELLHAGTNWKDVKILIIDYWYQYDPSQRYEQFKKHWEIYPDISVEHISPKPSPWQGLHKVTKSNYFAASNARNTAFLNCHSQYIVCIDDLTVIKPGWYEVVRWGAQHNHVVLGSYAKVKNLSCKEDGTFSFDEFPPGLDSRFNNGVIKNDFAQLVAGSWLFGCSFGLPLDLALQVDGFDEACDGQGAEDYDFGIRLGRITSNIYYSRQMFTYEDEDLHFTSDNVKFIRHSRMLTEKTHMPKYKGMSSDHAMLQNVLTNNSHLPFVANNLRNYTKDPDTFKLERDWCNDMCLADM